MPIKSSLITKKNEITIPGGSEVILQHRTKTLVKVEGENHKENETTLVVCQEIMKSVSFSNGITKVKNKNVLVILIKIIKNVIAIKFSPI